MLRVYLLTFEYPKIIELIMRGSASEKSDACPRNSKH